MTIRQFSISAAVVLFGMATGAAAASLPTGYTVPIYQSGCPARAPFRCADGTCKTNGKLCPLRSAVTNRCSADLPIRCSDGSCAASLASCPSLSKCSVYTPYQCEDGTCVSTPNDCLPACPADRSVRCSNGGCRATEADCATVDHPCPEDFPYLCADKSCKKSRSECKRTDGCPSGTRMCPTGICRKLMSQCPVPPDSNGSCPRLKPFMCRDGSCVKKVADCIWVR